MSLVQEYSAVFEKVVDEHVAIIIKELVNASENSIVLGSCTFVVPSKYVLEQVLEILLDKDEVKGIRFKGQMERGYWNSCGKITASWPLEYKKD